jgi:DNA-binding response OmpR family regulator
LRSPKRGPSLKASPTSRREFDLVLADVCLPDGNGYQLCRTLHEQRADVPIVLISSAYVDDTARTAATFAGAAGFLAEPVSAQILVSTIKSHLT